MSKNEAIETLVISPAKGLRGSTPVPGDKSLSHRALLLGALAAGKTEVRGWLAAGDTEATLGAVRTLGIRIDRHDTNTLTVYGGTMQQPQSVLDFVNAGTGIRLAAGILAGQPFASTLDGSYQLRRRPMRRITEPLSLMGARISSDEGKCPLVIEPAALHGIEYAMPVASAQVKSAILLAGLFAQGDTTIIEPGPARDHTERMLVSMGARIRTEGNRVIVSPAPSLQPMDMTVPGDFSSAAFVMVAATIVPDSDVTLTGVNLNLTRTGLLDILQEMGADIVAQETGLEAGEPVGTIRIRSSQLRGMEVGGEVVVRMIDEFPVFMIAALCADGETIVRDARELRVKETDRIAVMAGELRKMGAVIEEREDGFRIMGRQALHAATVEGHDDHRIAMSLSVAALVTPGDTVVNDTRCTRDSFPGFADLLRHLGAEVREA
jgi:3-phosphoshikimate 1-carboxyvinyltransferase